MLTWEQTFQEIEQGKPEIAILPIGAIEQHSFHLPIGTDWLLAQEVARRVAERLGAWLLPALPYSNSREHSGFAGTLWLRPATLVSVIEDLVLSLRHQGVRRIVILNAHGGNWILKPTVRELNLSYPDLKVIFSSAGALAGGVGTQEDLHAGEGETSSMLALYPDLVKAKRSDYVPSEGREFLDYVGVRKVTPTGVWGRASRATREQGERQLAEAVERIVAYVQATFKRLEEIEKGAS
jgi:creatinine amidohydrolase